MRNIEVEFFESLEDVKSHILDIIPIECTIGIGHSATLEKFGITHTLIERGNVVFDPDKVIIVVGKNKVVETIEEAVNEECGF